MRKYITASSSLNIPYDGEASDWHLLGLIRSGNYHIANENYESAPGVFTGDEELFDCSGFLKKHNVKEPVPDLCATPYRAIVDIVYRSIFTLNKYPYHFMLDEYMLEHIDREKLRGYLNKLSCMAVDSQRLILQKWINDNREFLMAYC